jgi:hypothetical protein
MDRSSDRNRIIEYLQIKPISHSQIYTSQIAVPESQGGEIPRNRRETLREKSDRARQQLDSFNCTPHRSLQQRRRI